MVDWIPRQRHTAPGPLGISPRPLGNALNYRFASRFCFLRGEWISRPKFLHSRIGRDTIASNYSRRTHNWGHYRRQSDETRDESVGFENGRRRGRQNHQPTQLAGFDVGVLVSAEMTKTR